MGTKRREIYCDKRISLGKNDKIFIQKCAQPHDSLSCKLGNSAQFSIRTPIELNTLCFVLILIHYTSLIGDFVKYASLRLNYG